MLQLKIT